MLKKRYFSQGIDSFARSDMFSEPYFLRTVFLEELGDNGGSNHKLLAIAVHAVLMESGFVGFDPVSGLQTDRFPFPDEFFSPVSLCYSLPALLRVDLDNSSGSNVTDYVVLTFLSLGRFIQVHGSLVKGSGIHKLSLNEYKFAPTLKSVRANSAKNDGSFDLNLENGIMGFWRIVKDGLALPLLIDLCSKTHLALPPCFVRLPTELKLKVLDSLPGTDIARMECVCSEMRNLASGNDLWKRKVEQEFGDKWLEAEGGGTKKWKVVFRSRWENRKKLIRLEPSYAPACPSFDPSWLQPDHPYYNICSSDF